MSVNELSRAVELLARQVGHWSPARWAAPASTANMARGELVHHCVQQVANLAADAEGQPRRSVPRLDNDLALLDQLRVVTADLIAADPPPEAMAAATAEVSATRRAIS